MSALPIHEDPIPALRLSLDRQFSDQELARVLGLDDPIALSLARRALHPPLADMLARPGKEVRARMVEHAYAVAHAVSPCTCARLPPEIPQLVEMLHAGSLVIDDIEDGADDRRGAPALHRVWGVPIALNAGNWLYFWPLLTLGSLPLDGKTVTSMFRRTATTMVRCHQGQALDLALRVDELARYEIATAVETTTRLKTGSLIELSCSLGAIAAHAPSRVERALARFGLAVGQALQMYDDLGSILSPSRRAKGHEDLVAARPTWPWAWLARSVDERTFASLQRDAAHARESGDTGALLERLRAEVEPWREEPRAHLGAAIADLRDALGDHDTIDRLVRDLRTLERAYA